MDENITSDRIFEINYHQIYLYDFITNTLTFTLFQMLDK